MIRNDDVDMTMLKEGERAEYAALIRSWLEGIMYGNEEHKWAYVIEGEEEK